ncbi:MAG: hypothetical protein JW798_16355 [Prolixibacteraceae bacterium]|nr:hypothetical protein [Prolixibacteraceae bacterium]
MKKILVLLFLFISVWGFSQTAEILQKAQALADQYEATGVTPAQAQAAENLLIGYFTDIVNNTPVSPATQAQVDIILDAINSGAPLSATAVQITVNGELTSADPTYNRVIASGFNIGCITQGTLSGVGTDVYYDVIEFSVTHAGLVDIEVTSFPEDSYLAIYCVFDPLNPRDNLILTNDDGGSCSLCSRLVDMPLPVGTYYLVMHTFGNGEVGNYTIEFRSDDGVVVLGSSAVPVNIWWIAGIFVLLAGGIIVKKIFF